MDHEFELAFNLLDEAAGRIQEQQYGITRILFHNHGKILLTTVHDYTPEDGHRLVLLANDDHGQMAAVEATAPDLDTTPATRILKVRAGDITFHAVPRHLVLPRHRIRAHLHTHRRNRRRADVDTRHRPGRTRRLRRPRRRHRRRTQQLASRRLTNPPSPAGPALTAGPATTTPTRTENNHARNRLRAGL